MNTTTTIAQQILDAKARITHCEQLLARLPHPQSTVGQSVAFQLREERRILSDLFAEQEAQPVEEKIAELTAAYGEDFVNVTRYSDGGVQVTITLRGSR